MLASMTGYGAGRVEAADRTVLAELRAVNHRHFKLSVRGSEPYPQLETEFEKLLKPVVKRGTVTLFLRVERNSKSGPAPLNTGQLQRYLDQLLPITSRLPANQQASLLANVLSLPGISQAESPGLSAPEDEWPTVESAVKIALDAFQKSRIVEGRLMAAELAKFANQISAHLESVRQELPAVMRDYRERLLTRLKQAVADAGIQLDEANIIRELALFADRSDVSEELTRLTGHLAAMNDVLTHGGDAGRRLEFLAQEMGREANTLGSKAGNVVVSRHAVEIKATLEKMRELVLNLE